MPRMKHVHADVWLDRNNNGVVGKLCDEGLKDVDVLDLAGRLALGSCNRMEEGGTCRDEPEAEAVDV